MKWKKINKRLSNNYCLVPVTINQLCTFFANKNSEENDGKLFKNNFDSWLDMVHEPYETIDQSMITTVT